MEAEVLPAERELAEHAASASGAAGTRYTVGSATSDDRLAFRSPDIWTLEPMDDRAHGILQSAHRHWPWGGSCPTARV